MSLDNIVTRISNEQIESSTNSKRKPNLKNNNQARVSRMRSKNTLKTCGLQDGYSNVVGKPSKDSSLFKATVSSNAKIQSARRIPSERNSFGLQSGCSNVVETSHNKSSVKSPMDKATRSTKVRNQSVKRICREQNSLGLQHGTGQIKSSTVAPMVKTIGSKEKIQSGQAQRHLLTQKKKDTTPTIKKSITHAKSISRQVWQKKEKSQPSKRKSEPQSQQTAPEYHIMWDGFDEPCEPVGLNCHLCEGDLAYSPIGMESERYDYEEEEEEFSLLLEEVSFLPCGHAFHSKCLQLNTSEEQSRCPTCFICVSLACFDSATV